MEEVKEGEKLKIYFIKVFSTIRIMVNWHDLQSGAYFGQHETDSKVK